MAWGGKAYQGVRESIASLHKVCPNMPVIVVGDAEAKGLEGTLPGVQVRVLKTDPFRGAEFLAGKIKPQLYRISPWDLTLYVDADTIFRQAPDLGFDLLGKWDFIVAETMNRTLKSSIAGVRETSWSRNHFGSPEILYHNSGMLFWRKNERVQKLFELWSTEWLRFSGWDEQVALLRALAASDAIFLTVPYSWNTNWPGRAYILHHDFGTRKVWKHRRRRGRLRTADELRLIARHIREEARAARKPRPALPRHKRLPMAKEAPPQKRTGREQAIRDMRARKPRRAPRNKAVEPAENK